MTPKLWRVRLMQTVIEHAWVTVEADNEDDAREMAQRDVSCGDIEADWEFTECHGDIEAVHVEEHVA